MPDAAPCIDARAAATQLLVRAPRTVADLALLCGGSARLVRRWLKALEAEGLVRRTRGRRLDDGEGFAPDTWTWIA